MKKYYYLDENGNKKEFKWKTPYGSDHVGYVYKVDDDYIYTIEGNTIIMVTHNPALTVYATRVINMLDGQIDTDVKTVADHNLPQPIEVKVKKRKHRSRRKK